MVLKSSTLRPPHTLDDGAARLWRPLAARRSYKKPGDGGAGHKAIHRHSLVRMSLGGCAKLYRTLAPIPEPPNLPVGYNGGNTTHPAQFDLLAYQTVGSSS